MQAIHILLFDEPASAEDPEPRQRQFEELLNRAFAPLEKHRHIIDVEDDM